MRKEILFALTAFFFFSLTAITVAYAVEKEDKTEEIIYEEETDISHDAQQEKVILKGITSDDTENSPFFNQLTLEVIQESGESTKLDLEGGYSPKLHLLDINDDGQKEMFLTVLGNERGSQKNFYFYQLQKDELIELTKPELSSIASEFKDGYKAQLTIEDKKTYIFDLYERKNHYEELGLYHEGRLNEPTELIVGPYTELKITRIDNKTAIKGKQRISGLATVDTVGYLETIWTWKNTDWSLEKVIVKEISHKSN
ncbi:hypothetical protein [Bacillus sp. B1-b2]|uniref:hypothetical protein n=1 Tax=Bacillus sp. B1-b2 TaxID=2653201 RepID=UPI001261B7E6|nr:hypothetical protein [Bacillus sp. B1-b2]KAB7671269.1 hypothetical protein F9279_07100 [Bacillus sp. B1-b2]